MFNFWEATWQNFSKPGSTILCTHPGSWNIRGTPWACPSWHSCHLCLKDTLKEQGIEYSFLPFVHTDTFVWLQNVSGRNQKKLVTYSLGRKTKLLLLLPFTPLFYLNFSMWMHELFNRNLLISGEEWVEGWMTGGWWLDEYRWMNG